VTANADEADAPLGDQATRETLCRPKQLGDLGDSEKPFHLGD
jgi:hypothetical protein